MHKASCPKCGGTTYPLGDGRRKCRRCGARFSPAKIERRERIIDAFCRNLSAHAAARELGLSYVTVKKGYEEIREALLPWLEEQYSPYRDRILEYDEYIYLDRNKRRDKRYIFDGYNFLTFDYGGRVYNILMPPLSHYKSGLLSDGLERLYYDEFSKFLTFHRIARLKSRENTIVRFWRYFDEFMRRFKGIGQERFIYYLKEAEFKFNTLELEWGETLLQILDRSSKEK